MPTDAFESKRPPEPQGEKGGVELEAPMPEGEELAPAGVKLMAVVRWGLLALAALVAAFSWWSYAKGGPPGRPEATRASAKYHCPMHPQIVSNEPGECPICHMNLEPIAPFAPAAPGALPAASASPTSPSSSAASSAGTPLAPPSLAGTPLAGAAPAGAPPVGGAPRRPTPPGTMPPGTVPITLTLDRVQSIGVRTAVVGEGSMTSSLRATAVVEPTEQGVAEVHVRSAGFVEQLFVAQTGVPVARHERLFTVYSPEIFQAESELLATHRWEAADAAGTTAAAARRKLELLGMSPQDIDEVLKTGEPLRAIPVYAPQAGYVTKKNLVKGSYVTPETPLYEIQDLSRVYVVADVFQQDVGFLHKGTVGRFVPSRHPDEAAEARVDLLYPTMNAEARTVRVRMQVQNTKGLTFRPGEYGTVEFATPARRGLTVPRDAVVDTGLDAYVFVVQGEGTFSPREVVLGGEQGELAIVLAGVSAGERVVSGATFMIDSESRLQASARQAAARP